MHKIYVIRPGIEIHQAPILRLLKYVHTENPRAIYDGEGMEKANDFIRYYLMQIEINIIDSNLNGTDYKSNNTKDDEWYSINSHITASSTHSLLLYQER